MSRRRPRRLLVLALVVAAASGVVYWQRERIRGLFEGAASDKSVPEIDRLHTVKRQSFKIVLREQGTLRAEKSTNISVAQGLPVRAKLTWLIDDGTKVKKGDKVAELEKKELEERILRNEETLAGKRKELDLAKQILLLAKSREGVKWQNAEKRLEQSIKDKDKYIRLEAPKKTADLEVTIEGARDKVEAARKGLGNAQDKVGDELFVDESQREKNMKELENKKRQHETALKGLESAQLQMKIFKRHTYPDRLKDLDDSITAAKMNLEDAKVQAKTDINEAQTALEQVELRIKQLDDALNKEKGFLEKMVLKAPIDGVVYTGESGRRQRYSTRRVEVGSDLWGGVTVAHIPNVEEFNVKTSVPEESRSKVKKELPASVKLPAIPDLVLVGNIREIAHKSHNVVRWDSSSPKAFNVTIEIKGKDDRLISGMTARVEIFVDEIKDVLAVPIEAVFREQDKSFVYRQSNGRAEKVFITPKESNEDLVAVEGLKEGDRVYLFDPLK